MWTNEFRARVCKIARGPIAVAKRSNHSKAPPQSNKVRVPTSRTRVMIGERRDRGAGPPAEEDVRTPARSLRDIHRCLGKRRSSSRPGSRGAFGRRGRPERVRGVPQIDRGKGRRLGRVPNARRLPATVDRSPLERTSPRRSTPAVGHSPSGCILARPVAVRRADRSRGPRPFGPLGARRSVVGGRAGRPGPGIGRARAVLGRTGLAGRVSLVTSSTSGREAVCRRSGRAPGIGQTP